MLQAINPPGPGIPGLSQAVLVGQGRLLILSGHVPFGPNGLVGDTHEAQLAQVFENMSATLKAAGTDFSAVARLTIFVKNYSQELLPTIRAVRDRWVNADRPPASALIGVAELFISDALVEVDAIAVLPPA